MYIYAFGGTVEADLRRFLLVVIVALALLAYFSFRHLTTIDNTNDTVGYTMVASLALLGGIFAFLIIRAYGPAVQRRWQPLRIMRHWMNAKEKKWERRAIGDGAASSERRKPD